MMVVSTVRRWLRKQSTVSTRNSLRKWRRHLLGLERLEDRNLLSNVVTWINPHGGDWGDAGNWSGGSLPGVGDDAVINLTGETVTISGTDAAVNSLVSAAPIALTGGSLSVAATSSINAALAQSSGTLGGSGNLKVGGQWTWTGGYVTGHL